MVHPSSTSASFSSAYGICNITVFFSLVFVKEGGRVRGRENFHSMKGSGNGGMAGEAGLKGRLRLARPLNF